MKRFLIGVTASVMAGVLGGCDQTTVKPAEVATHASAPLNYNRDVRPILSDKCFQCHGPDEKKRDSGLRLDLFASATVANPKSGHVPLVPGHPEKSEAWARIVTEDEDDRMPPVSSHKTLSGTEKDILSRWIKEGAKYEMHWSFAPIHLPPMPRVKRSDWSRNPVDAFILDRLERENIAPSPEAARAELLRRVTLDLTGLPPSSQEVAAFAADTAPDAYEKQVDRLLASPRYGEHMAMGWMDIARYADTDGFQRDRTRTMWPWRDWVAEAYNADLPYDQFVTWQLAGDLMPNATPEQILASGFNRNHMLNNEGGRDPEENRTDYVVDRTIVTGTAFLGLTMECCRCHDHKFDPLPTKDFYTMSAFFNQTDENGNDNSWGPRHAYQTKQFGEQTTLVMGDLPPEKWRKTWIQIRGIWDQHGDEVTAAVPAAIAPALSADAPKNRLSLAKWMTSPDHPLLARVEANRQWQRFFGYGLTRTPEDFGLQSEYPSHPELLDFLAASFRDGGWKTKDLQRLLVTSASYRQASRVRAELAESDPLNRLLARQNRFRLPSAVIRDQALAVSGLLVEQVGGPPVMPYQPPGLWEEVTNGTVHYTQGKGPDLYRRSLYVFWRRLIAPTSFFDVSNRQTCRVNPVRTNTPLQALALFNDPAFAEAARVLAQNVMLDAPAADSTSRIRAAFARVLCRPARPEELTPLVAGFTRMRERYGAAPAEAAALITTTGDTPPPANLSAAQQVDLAALANVCAVILNLDEVLTRE